MASLQLWYSLWCLRFVYSLVIFLCLSEFPSGSVYKHGASGKLLGSHQLGARNLLQNQSVPTKEIRKNLFMYHLLTYLYLLSGYCCC